MKKENARLLAQKKAIERILTSDDGKLLLQYLADITLPDMGLPCQELGQYAFRQGQRSILITLLQFCEKPASDFCVESIWDLIKIRENKYNG